MIVNKDGMAWVGRIINMAPIEGADKIDSATVVCGAGGRWGAVVPKTMSVGQLVACFLPDAIVPQTEPFAFMEKRKWRVSMMRLRGAPSEVLAMALPELGVSACSDSLRFGTDITDMLGVKKYEKELPANIGGDALGFLPTYIPKTDEPNFQGVPHLVEACIEKEVYITTKYDGTSQTVFCLDGSVRACSRRLELRDAKGVAVWELVDRYGLRDKLPEFGEYALQWECIGPKVQGNPLGLTTIDCRVFNVYDIKRKVYLDLATALTIVGELGLPFVGIEFGGVLDEEYYTDDALRAMAEGVYPNGHAREGIVIRPTQEMSVLGERVSFKVINLRYKSRS